MNILFRNSNPVGNLGEPKNGVNVAQRRRETYIYSIQGEPTTPAGLLQGKRCE
jgi:hypothetical protein